MMYVTLIFIFCLGAIIGSFLNVIILRLPKGQKINGRSKCPACGYKLKPWELVPIFSFVALRGKCSKCGRKISWRYLIIEALTGSLFVLVWLYAGSILPSGIVNLFRFWVIACSLIIIFVVDLENFIILDRVLVVSIIFILSLGLLSDVLSGSRVTAFSSLTGKAVLGAILTPMPFFLLWYISKGRWIGFGDVKLAAWLGAAYGLVLSIAVIFLGVILGGVVSVFLLSSPNRTLKSKVPFGTFLAVGGIVTLFFGEKLLFWYLALLGF